MGSATSKVSRAASATTGAAARKYPNRPMNSPATNQNLDRTANIAASPSSFEQPRQSAEVHPPPSASGTRNEAINIDASDPHFAQFLRSLGPVRPFPTLSSNSPVTPPSATRGSRPDPRLNPALVVLDARSKIQQAADLEFQQLGTKGHAGREFLDAGTIRQILIQRDRHGKSAEEIEKDLSLKPGVVARLGPKGVFSVPLEVGRAEKGVEMV